MKVAGCRLLVQKLNLFFFTKKFFEKKQKGLFETGNRQPATNILLSVETESFITSI